MIKIPRVQFYVTSHLFQGLHIENPWSLRTMSSSAILNVKHIKICIYIMLKKIYAN